MAIVRRNGGDETGGSNAARIRRNRKKKIKLPTPANEQVSKGIKARTIKPSPALVGEVAEIMQLWNTQSPGTIHILANKKVNYGRTRTGILSLDICLAGGWQRSRMGMVYGERSSGKSTILARSIANALRDFPDKLAVIEDPEGTTDLAWLRHHGCDLERVLVIEPATGEDAVDQFDAMIRAKEVCFIGLDSVAMVIPFKEIDSSAEDNQIGLQARLIGKMLRRATNALLQERRRDHHPTVLLLNQFRMKAGLVFGDPRTLPGGKALEFATSQQAETKNKEIRSPDGSFVRHNEHSVLITKDKTGGRYKEAKFKLIRDDESTGLPVGFIDQAATIIEHGEKAGVVHGRYEIDGISTKFRKAADLSLYLAENPDKEFEIATKILNYYRNKWGVTE